MDYVHSKIKGIFAIFSIAILNFRIFLSWFDIEQNHLRYPLHIFATLELLGALWLCPEVGKFNWPIFSSIVILTSNQQQF
jgi:hypothetical protein